ncbi:MAG: hypothetical protein GDA39_09150 [Hyphomonadaceae bacterium]|nr:hypothetical protein [Hyphomonadaceae bacterium]MBC6413007.1 hypothetical protein [Hyphomonadaceae bacterium]
MKSVAVLISDNLLPDAENSRVDRFELEEEMSKLVPAFADNGMKLDEVRWREASGRAPDYDAMLPLFVWDYFEGNAAAFCREMARTSQLTRLYNNLDVINWNSDKAYLDELAKLGAPVLETVTLERVTRAGVAKAFEITNADKLVIKPQTGGGAWRQVLFHKDDVFPDTSRLPPAAALVQPFLPSVQDEGEYSFVYFGGQFSHACVKRPGAGDYRVQSIYGGTEKTYTPTAGERQSAEDILDVLDIVPLYARVDLLRGPDGQLRLIELELIEPYLYLPHAEGEGGENKGAQRLAGALLKGLGSPDPIPVPVYKTSPLYKT